MGLIQNQMNGDGPVPKGPAELNRIQHMQDEDGQKARGGVTGEGQELSVEDESRINDGTEGEMYGHHVNGRAQVLNLTVEDQIQVVELDRTNTTGSHEKTQAPLVRWERFLPVRSLKVLLVENDDSTRHVVSALLRNCGYEVVAVANGLQAWKVLEDLTANIDLVLTEVNLPCETGIGLLSKIMNHKSHKNIPVIMMSSHDSMSIVFKCLSKGAVDFLVKPIRKNELRNLWQHVWRKCQSSSGSGSESGVRTQKSTKSGREEHSDNKHDNNYDEDDIGSTGLNARDRSDNGSGTQSPWTKIVVEVDSPRRMSPWDHLTDQPGGTCAQVTPSTPEENDNNRVRLTKGGETQVDELVLNMVTDKELETGVPRTLTLQPQNQRKEVPSNLSSSNQPKINSEKEKVDEEKEKGQLIEPNSEKQNGECKSQIADPKDAITSNATNPMLEVQVADNPNGKARCMNDKNGHGYNEVASLDLRMKPVKDKNPYGYNEASSFDFSAKTSNTVTFHGSSALDQNILRHSDNSAFSRYNLASHQAPTGNVGSCSPIDNSSEAAKTESMQGMQYFNKMPPNQNSNGSNNINDMGSSTIDKPTQIPTVKHLNPSSAFQVAQNASPQNVPQENRERQHIQVQHHYHHHHHHHHHMHNMVAHQKVNYNGQSVQNKTAPSPHDGSSNVLSAAINSDAGNQSLNGSASGSNHGSNLHIGCNATLIAEGCNMENDFRIAEKEGKIINGRNFETTNATIQARFPQREAALQKFRQKRKERCFEKKVRYQSRKKLAEQRPRVRGQFVRQAKEENKEKDARP